MQCKQGSCPHWDDCPRADDTKWRSPACIPMALQFPTTLHQAAMGVLDSPEADAASAEQAHMVGLRLYGYTCLKCGALKGLMCRYDTTTCDMCDGIAPLTTDLPPLRGSPMKCTRCNHPMSEYMYHHLLTGDILCRECHDEITNNKGDKNEKV